MRAWVVLLGLLTFGAIMLAGGVAHRSPEDRVLSWLSIIVGGLFMLLGAIPLILGDAKAVLPIPKVDKRTMLQFGKVLMAAGMLATFWAIVFPNPVTVGIAPWVKWVYVAGAVFTLLTGIALVVAGRSRHKSGS